MEKFRSHGSRDSRCVLGRPLLKEGTLAAPTRKGLYGLDQIEAMQGGIESCGAFFLIIFLFVCLKIISEGITVPDS